MSVWWPPLGTPAKKRVRTLHGCALTVEEVDGVWMWTCLPPDESRPMVDAGADEADAREEAMSAARGWLLAHQDLMQRCELRTALDALVDQEKGAA